MPYNSRFNIINFRGDRKTAEMQMIDGRRVTVHREDRIPVEYYGDVKTAEYQDHFVFVSPDNTANTTHLLCTCGAPAIIVAPDVYARKVHDASPSGYMMVCQFHLETGHHAK